MCIVLYCERMVPFNCSLIDCVSDPLYFLELLSLSMRVSAELLLVPRLPFSVGRNLVRRDGGFHSLFVALHDALFGSCWV